MSRYVLAASAVLPLCVLATPAQATLYAGNPKLAVLMDHASGELLEGDATLERVQLHACGGGGPTLQLGVYFDPVAGLRVPIPAGDWCAVTLEWDGVTTLYAQSWTGESDAPGTWSDLDLQTPAPALAPFWITEGTPQGGNPRVVVWVE